ncbi:MAG TPA: hypothetical protein VJ326_09535 [Thermoplasmata archaeon]|nr:hypothetical protein [Thermoplasmata archaeon]
MARRCPECYAELPDSAVWVCPACAFTLRTPAVSKFGIAMMLAGLALLAMYILGPERVLPREGLIPFELVDLMVANFPIVVVGTLGLGMLLVLAGALKVRGERARVAG